MYSLISNVPLLVRLATIRPHHEEVGAVVDIKTTEAIASVVVVLSCTTSVVPMLLIHRLEAESRGDASGIPRAVTGRVAVRVHIAEGVAVGVNRRT